jgi:hypothetical protein
MFIKKTVEKEASRNYFRERGREKEIKKILENTFKASSMVGMLSS